MNSQQTEILVIASGSSELESYFSVLAENFSVHTEFQSENILDAASNLNPIIIILDIDEQNSDRLECCKAIKENSNLAETPIIIATLNHSLEERIHGYDAGAFGYLEFPIDVRHLKNNINKLLLHATQKEQLTTDAQTATTTALSAMVGNSELGQAIRFVEKTYAINSFDALASSFFNVTNTLNLNCVIFIKSANELKFYSSNNKVLPIESELLERMHDEANRFVDLKNRTLIFYPHISILIKNMPLDEAEKYGRIKDLLPSMMGSADARIIALDTENALIDQADSVSHTFNNIKETLEAILNDFSANQKLNMDTMNTMLTELDFNIPRMGLEEDQEEYLLARVGQAVADAEIIMDNSEKLNHSFESIGMLLNHLTGQQQAILELVRSQKEEQEDQTPEDDIEFF